MTTNKMSKNVLARLGCNRKVAWAFAKAAQKAAKKGMRS